MPFSRLNHLISIKQFNRDDILTLLQSANDLLKNLCLANQISQQLKGKLVANLFFEPSTRTCNSFEIAAKRLGALTISPNMQSSSLSKGESLLDTIKSIEAMGVDAFVIRHHENGVMEWLAKRIGDQCHLINAGEGWLAHPTQALLDLMTIQQHKPQWESLRIAIIGDLRHSRVSRSLINALHIMGVSTIRLIAPETLHPEEDILRNHQLFTQIDKGIRDADVIICLRLQKERMGQKHLINESEFHQHFCLTEKNLKLAKPDAIVMHPGPINRNIEITPAVADGPQSVILQQIQNGVALRMAVLQAMLT